EPAVANGWLQRAHRLINGLEPCVDHGWLAIHEGHMAVALDEDTAKARRLAAQAVELGRRFGAPELEMLGLGLEGRALVSDGVLSWQGRWQEAETQLSAAVGGLESSRPPMVGDALARLGELRRRQGRAAEAEELFARSETHTLSLLGRAALALDSDQPSEAAELADRYLRRFSDRGRVERSAGLELAIRALARLGEDERANEALSELREIAARARTRPILAAVSSSEGTLAVERGDHDAARRSFED